MSYEYYSPLFSREEMIKYLKSWGYTIRKKMVTFSYSVYHNDVECKDVKCDAVYRGKVLVGEPKQHDDPVKDIFDREFKTRLFKTLS